jgi:hypothetical protein
LYLLKKTDELLYHRERIIVIVQKQYSAYPLAISKECAKIPLEVKKGDKGKSIS